MAKKRLIFTLLVSKGAFQLSRNFGLQNVGNYEWLLNMYSFNAIADSIDELVILNVERDSTSIDAFAANISQVIQGLFCPLAAGGGIRSVEDAEKLLRAGADKLVFGAPLFKQPELVRACVEKYGSQCVIASIDYRLVNNERRVFISHGKEDTGFTVEQAMAVCAELNVGEIYLTFIEKDGTGQGFDLKFIETIAKQSTVPVIASGGVGDYKHLYEGLLVTQAASTANIFNFVGEGLREARSFIRSKGVDLAVWEGL